ncbi:hypothetical protein [Micromonospora sp. C95]|uniref:hypothetical protein n=1 Tax=Micromonospora sp. C95 TaxID=2824882 RepID=UPI001B36B7C3|nr:hypothetical protein [Micromonospora sp. C95]MBQ1025355.1 hypothetical protein [Micromonospora sp. C95]
MVWIGPASEKETTVPDLVGLSVEAAWQVTTDHHLKMTSGDPDGPPLSQLTSTGVWLITDQQPPAGTTMRRYGSMAVVVEQVPDNLAGDREPRRPSPRLDGLGAELNPATDSDPIR